MLCPLEWRAWAAWYDDVPGHGLQEHAESAQNRVSDAGQPSPDRAEDARVLGPDGPLQAAPRDARGPPDVAPPRRPAVRERPHPHGPRPEQGAEGRDREIALDARLQRGVR